MAPSGATRLSRGILVTWMVAKSTPHRLRNPGMMTPQTPTTMAAHGFKVQDSAHPQYHRRWAIRSVTESGRTLVSTMNHVHEH